MPIQDNLNGALLISAIDFILSFVIIGGIGVILALFPLLNKLRRQGDKIPLTVPHERFAHRESRPLAAISISSPSPQLAATGGLHPGLSDQQLVVLLTVAAHEVLERPVRVCKFRPLNTKDRNWATQGRQELQSHRLK